MDEFELQEMLKHLIEQEEAWGTDAFELAGCRVSTFDEAGVLTQDKGLILRLRDGSEFQITVIQSRAARG